MNMEVITSAASTALANIVLAVIALAGAYAVYYIRLAGAQVKAQTKQIEDESARALLEDALDDAPGKRSRPGQATGRSSWPWAGTSSTRSSVRSGRRRRRSS